MFSSFGEETERSLVGHRCASPALMRGTLVALPVLCSWESGRTCWPCPVVVVGEPVGLVLLLYCGSAMNYIDVLFIDGRDSISQQVIVMLQ